MPDAAQLWPEVTSPLARRVLKQLCDYSPAITDERDFARYEKQSSGLELEYRNWVRVRLERSALAQQLADGPAALPDICEAMPQPLRMLFRLLKPRTLEAQLSHLVAYLDWYLEPQRRFYNMKKMAAVVLMMAATIVFWRFPMMGLSGTIDGSTRIWIAAVMALLPALAILLASTAARYVGPDFATRRTVNATELYWHLRRSYSDSEPCATETASQLESAREGADRRAAAASGPGQAVRQ